ncbi:carbon-nitrogen hydrolase family protein [Streptomyces sp. RY43-2]|uniref:Carbon-nitrogen hydrolase family protein n=1 Tax=Streptomyces macrolidinus TaxID=2952607 RepID=A0ABT0ZM16_9ACTN|nr:carbon-nitrogen hydrolase family protein [Streptomyces macrolidinus]MCN9244634.1 carbon-nitrogen hydrolase family protein [Streptomyces macrolidinus]
MQPTRHPRVALLQTRWREDPEENLRQATDMLESLQEGTHLAVLPEFFLGPPFYFPGRQHLQGVVDHPIPDPVFDHLGAIARRKGCWIICGSVIERTDDGTYYNTAVVLDDTGAIVAKVRKVHLFSAEFVALRAGEEAVVLDTPFGRLGICVCSDFWIQEMPRLLALKGAEIIAVPAAALRNNLPATKPCVLSTAVLNAADVLYVGSIGKVSGERGGRTVTIDLAGHSTVATPEGITAELDEEEAVLYADLDLERLRQLREIDFSFQKTLYFGLHGRRPELYERLLKHADGVSDLGPVLGDYFRRRLKETFESSSAPE